MSAVYAIPPDMISAFGRHETFHPRYGWLKKAYDAIAENPKAFRRDDSIMKLGVGKNMVNAIRFWSLAFKMTKEGGDGLTTTAYGDAIFREDGIDPYLEMPDTLWLLHWLLLSRPCRVPVWWIILNNIASVRIRIDDLYDDVQRMVDESPAFDGPSQNSVRRDISVFMHMYTSKQDRLTPEEYLDCPFRNMGLIRYEGEQIRFAYGHKSGLTPEVVAFACSDFAAKSGTTMGSISAATLATYAGGVGNAFRLNEGDLAGCLEAASSSTRAFGTENINGTIHMTFQSAPDETARNILESLKRKREIVAR